MYTPPPKETYQDTKNEHRIWQVYRKIPIALKHIERCLPTLIYHFHLMSTNLKSQTHDF